MSPVIAPDGQVNGVAAIARDITERKEFEAQLQFLADHDVLTGLFNRRRFIDTLSHHIDLVNRYGPGGAVLILDLDNFKEINDTLGHSAGDETIRRRQRGARTQASLQPTSWLGSAATSSRCSSPRPTRSEARRVAADLLELLRRAAACSSPDAASGSRQAWAWRSSSQTRRLDSEGLLAERRPGDV